MTTEIPTPANASSIFWRYWVGTTVSGLGTAITSVALPLTAVLVVHASTFSVAAITAAGSVPSLLLGLPAGVYVARLPLRGVQVAMDLVRAAAIASIPVVGWTGHLSVLQLLIVAVVVGSAAVVFAVANSTMMPRIVPRDELTRRNSLNWASRGIAQFAGPGLGGVLVDAMGAASCMVVDAVSYLVSAVSLWTLPLPTGPPASFEPADFRREVQEGFAFIGSDPIVRATFILGVSVNLVTAGLLALTPLYIVRTLHEPPFVLGLVYSAEGAGGLAGAAVASRVGAAWGSAKTMLRCSLLFPVSLLLMPLAFHGAGVILFGLGIFVLVASMTVVGILTMTHRHRNVPMDMLPRLMAITRVVSWGGDPLGALIAGVIASTCGVRFALFVVAAAGLGAPLSLWTNRELRARTNLELD